MHLVGKNKSSSCACQQVAGSPHVAGAIEDGFLSDVEVEFLGQQLLLVALIAQQSHSLELKLGIPINNFPLGSICSSMGDYEWGCIDPH